MNLYDLVVNDVVVQCAFASILYNEKLGHQIYFWHFGHQPLTFVHEALCSSVHTQYTYYQ